MLKRGLISLSVLGLLSGMAGAQNSIREWTGASGYRIVEMTVWIDAPGTYKFETTDPNGVIDDIIVDPNCPSGTINLYVLRDPNESGGPGAAGISLLDLLTVPNVTANSGEM
jgi:hypothetical protein